MCGAFWDLAKLYSGLSPAYLDRSEGEQLSRTSDTALLGSLGRAYCLVAGLTYAASLSLPGLGSSASPFYQNKSWSGDAESLSHLI
ncbi:hypothetical protein RRG08_063201 [Elysia crispata]|uniref:Uncharacterized protein n=1 Tax=Elysia crispata TaxID=231223 RepID=A0AAE0YTH9_9GAST|nr:hypothetical protein RRG08_063201 [Elysia crispata]